MGREDQLDRVTKMCEILVASTLSEPEARVASAEGTIKQTTDALKAHATTGETRQAAINGLIKPQSSNPQN